MLPDEILSQLNSEFPCRDTQIRQLAALYSAHLPSPSLLVAHGLTATGKSALIKCYLSDSGLPHAIVNSKECITGRHLLERTMAACLDARDKHGSVGETKTKIDRRPYARTESLNTLVVSLGKLMGEWEGEDGMKGGKFVLVFDGIDAQREAPATLIPALARFGELIPNLSIILITTLPLTHSLHKPGVPHLHFPPYPRTSLLEILNTFPPKIFLSPPDADKFPDYTPDLSAEDDAWLWNRFLGAVWESLSKHTGRDLVSFRNTSMRIWREFVRPVVDGTFGTRDFSRLMVNRRHLFQLEDSVLDRIISRDAEASKTNGEILPATPKIVKKAPGLQHDLPYYTTYLLIAAYLASYNPSRTDITYFMKHTDKRKNRRRTGPTKASATKARKISRHLLTPSPFPLDRLLAVFRSLIDGDVPQVADLLTQISTLCSMRLLVKSGGMGSSDVLGEGGRWRVGFGWEFVRGLGRSVGIEVGEYLVGGVDV
ncbi:hypothetical protein K504DRAFT_404259 [Pleomassaria siparia CBS 279.74]|uniref:Uncharacterized protein n=1 Tax=Pleomassaria siparia CBS 279.74 TaxID=1314801 RepID=A0A6G1KDX1_9PLEO|nr:hypothetical protein K504DRAFT_404259 [Pleomassaria siparia CBS 279.74]